MKIHSNKSMIKNILLTGLEQCFDQKGMKITCSGSGQDASLKIGKTWPSPRFSAEKKDVVQDLLTNLTWTRKVNFFEFPLTWSQALEEIKSLNKQGFAGYNDWRMPNRRELRSIISHGHRKPALPEDHPFEDVFLGWYWTSTTAAIFPAYAWYIHLEGGRMFYGGKNQRYLTWPVRGESKDIPFSGQKKCFDEKGLEISCMRTGQDGELQKGQPWPHPRFSLINNHVHDKLTNLVWYNPGNLHTHPVNWVQALEMAGELKTDHNWRLPNINELESLVDTSKHTPALPQGHLFTNLQDGYWSSTTSFFEPDWAYVLYLNKGAVGVGFKPYLEFYVWPVRNLD